MEIVQLHHEIIQESLCLEEVLEQLKSTKPFSLEDMHSLLDALHSSGGTVFLMLDNGKAIGNVSVFIQTRFLGNGLRVAQIEDVTTHPRYERRNIASRLMRHAIDYAIAQGCYKICLYCNERLVSFYEKSGFAVENVFMQQRFSIDNG